MVRELWQSGMGKCRILFVLVSFYSSHSLKMRTFKTFDFYRKHEKDMTPAGLAFFQCQWDDTVTHVFRQLLGKKWHSVCFLSGVLSFPLTQDRSSTNVFMGLGLAVDSQRSLGQGR